jgi:hypothetical protein
MEPTELIRNYEGQATYQITVQGKVDPKFVNQLCDLSVMHTLSKGQTLSTITGEFEDQEALSGIMNILIDHQYHQHPALT